MKRALPVARPAPVAVEALRDALLEADYTHAGITAAIGDVAMEALHRSELVAAERATRGGSALETLIRLFLLREPVDMIRARAALPFALAWQLGLVEPVGGEVVATLDLRPYSVDDSTWWVVSDLSVEQTGAPLRADHVLGVGGASVTLAQLAPRNPVGDALDIGTGCGIQALHLAQHARSVTATDISSRALRLAAVTLALNGAEAELIEGSLLEPVKGRRFDQIVSNPPFVVGSGDGGFTYRDSGLVGDALSRTLIRALPGALMEDGTAQILANWMHVRGEPWTDRVGSWVNGLGCDAWVLQRDLQDPAGYVSLWLADAGSSSGAEHRARYDSWLAWFEMQKVEAVGLGLVMLRNAGHAAPTVVIEEAHQQIAPPLGPHVTSWFDRQDWLRQASDTTILDSSLRLAPDVTLEQVAQRDPDGGWAVLGQVLRQETGLRWREDVDQLVATLVSGFDGEHSVLDLVTVLAATYQLEADISGVLQATARAVRHLISRGFVAHE